MNYTRDIVKKGFNIVDTGLVNKVYHYKVNGKELNIYLNEKGRYLLTVEEVVKFLEDNIRTKEGMFHQLLAKSNRFRNFYEGHKELTDKDYTMFIDKDMLVFILGTLYSDSAKELYFALKTATSDIVRNQMVENYESIIKGLEGRMKAQQTILNNYNIQVKEETEEYTI